MRRKAMIATLLLPLPFAALPLVGVLLGMGGGSHTVVVDTRPAEARQIQLDSPKADAGSLAYGLSDPFQGGCGVQADLRAES